MLSEGRCRFANETKKYFCVNNKIYRIICPKSACWIAKDSNGDIYIYMIKPTFRDDMWCINYEDELVGIAEGLDYAFENTKASKSLRKLH